MFILIVGGDSVEALRKQATRGGVRWVEHWNGRSARDLAKTIPKETVVVIVLDRVKSCLGPAGAPGTHPSRHSGVIGGPEAHALYTSTRMSPRLP